MPLKLIVLLKKNSLGNFILFKGVVKVAKVLVPATFNIYMVVTDVCGLEDIQQLTVTVIGPNHVSNLIINKSPSSPRKI